MITNVLFTIIFMIITSCVLGGTIASFLNEKEIGEKLAMLAFSIAIVLVQIVLIGFASTGWRHFL